LSASVFALQTKLAYAPIYGNNNNFYRTIISSRRAQRCNIVIPLRLQIAIYLFRLCWTNNTNIRELSRSTRTRMNTRRVSIVYKFECVYVYIQSYHIHLRTSTHKSCVFRVNGYYIIKHHKHWRRDEEFDPVRIFRHMALSSQKVRNYPKKIIRLL